MERNPIVIGTRNSKLAKWQAIKVKKMIEEKFPDTKCVLKEVLTTGDVKTDIPLYSFKEIGVFTKELDISLLNKEIDIAVHSLKDIETDLHPEISIGAFLERESSEDALVLKTELRDKYTSIDQLPEGSIIGTSSVRRNAFLSKNCPHLTAKSIRGNLGTRLRKLDEENYSALILAAAGLERLGWENVISQKLNPNKFPPAVSQGTIAITKRKDNSKLTKILTKIDHSKSRFMCQSERAVLGKLEGGCKVPVGVFSRFSESNGGSKLIMDVTVVSPDGKSSVEKKGEVLFCRESDLEEREKTARRFGESMARDLFESGAKEILDRVKH